MFYKIYLSANGVGAEPFLVQKLASQEKLSHPVVLSEFNNCCSIGKKIKP